MASAARRMYEKSRLRLDPDQDAPVGAHEQIKPRLPNDKSGVGFTPTDDPQAEQSFVAQRTRRQSTVRQRPPLFQGLDNKGKPIMANNNAQAPTSPTFNFQRTIPSLDPRSQTIGRSQAQEMPGAYNESNAQQGDGQRASGQDNEATESLPEEEFILDNIGTEYDRTFEELTRHEIPTEMLEEPDESVAINPTVDLAQYLPPPNKDGALPSPYDKLNVQEVEKGSLHLASPSELRKLVNGMPELAYAFLARIVTIKI